MKSQPQNTELKNNHEQLPMTITLVFVLFEAGLEKSTRPLRASENLDDLHCKLTFFPYMPIIFVMQGKCLFQDISRPVRSSYLSKSIVMARWSVHLITLC